MFCQSIFSSKFSTVIWRLLLWLPVTYNPTGILEYCGRCSYDFTASVDGLGLLSGPMLAVLGLSQDLCCRSWAALRAYVGGLGLPWGLCGRSWAALRAYVGSLGLLLGPCGRSWALLGSSVGGPGLLLGPLWAVLGCSWGLCRRSWAALGSSVDGLAPR